MAPTHASPRAPRRGLLWCGLQVLASILTRVLLDLKVRGRSNIPAHGGVLIVSNHQSFLDPVVVAVQLDRQMAFLADAYLFKIKPFAWLIRSLNAFPIQTGRGDMGAIKEMMRLLSEGWMLNVFPEGTRTPDGKLQKVEAGVALVIRRAKVSVVPAFISGAYDAWPRQRKLPRPGKVRVVYRPAINLWEMSGSEIVAELNRIFKEMEAEAEADLLRESA